MDTALATDSSNKKQRVSFGEVEYSEVPADIRITMKANDIIDLIFVEEERRILQTYRPDFTHQLFENESVELFASLNSNHRVSIEVNCSNLAHKVSYGDGLADLDVTTLQSSLSKAIPRDDHEESIELGVGDGVVPVGRGAPAPPGKLIHQFKVRTVAYEVYLATAKDSGASLLLSNAEKLAMWFIETADAVDFSDDRWEALFLYARDDTAKPDATFSFAGYMTLFSFRNPFKGTKLRVCQALVLPHRQGQGLGREMLLCVYKHIVQPRSDICELTVEDPALGFQRMRDAVDLECLVAHCPSLFTTAADGSKTDSGTVAATASAPSEQDLCTALKIIKAQAQFLLEFVEYVHLMRTLLSRADPSTANTDTSSAADAPTRGAKRPLNGTTGDLKPLVKLLETNDDFKSFRLRVKRRILKNDKELASIAPKSEMQKALSEEFSEELKRFHALESTAKRLCLVVDTLNSLY